MPYLFYLGDLSPPLLFRGSNGVFHEPKYYTVMRYPVRNCQHHQSILKISGYLPWRHQKSPKVLHCYFDIRYPVRNYQHHQSNLKNVGHHPWSHPKSSKLISWSRNFFFSNTRIEIEKVPFKNYLIDFLVKHTCFPRKMFFL